MKKILQSIAGDLLSNTDLNHEKKAQNNEISEKNNMLLKDIV